jgi:hypothetical protein
MSFRTTVVIDLEAADSWAVLNARHKLERVVNDLRNQFSKYKDKTLIHASFNGEIREVGKAKAAG